jgi:hypothetical protein
MSAKATQADDSTGLPTDVHGKLANRVQTLRECIEQAEGDYYLEVERCSEIHGTWSIVIDSDDWILNEGEIGDMRFHVILGPQGGLRLATGTRDFAGETDYLDAHDTKGRAWSRLKTAIKRAK